MDSNLERDATIMTTDAPSHCTRIDQLVAHWARQRPDAPALSEAGEARSFAGLEAEVEAAAAVLRDAGVGAGDRVLIVLENGLAAVTVILASCRLGAWAVPINARLSARELDTIRDHARPRVTLYTLASSPAADDHARRDGAEPVVALPSLGLACRREDGDPAPEPDPGAGRDSIAVLIYTSGTTGAPKGVMLSHANLLFVAERTSAIRGLALDDLAYLVLPISHVYGLAAILTGYLYRGVPVELVPRFDPEAVARALAEGGITAFSGVPAMYAHLIALAERRGGRLPAPALRYLSIGGAPVDLALKRQTEATFGVPLYNGYGLTETSPSVATTRIGDERDDDSVGTLLDDVEVRIVADDGRALPTGEVGEIWVRGGLVMRGYYRDPARTAEAVTPEGWFKTGDLGRLGADGHLYLVGRLKDLIIRSGFNVYPVEVEGVLAAFPGVALSAVLGRRRDGNEEVVAFVQPRPGAALDPGALAAFAAERLAPYKRPAEYILRPALPVTAAGKVLRQQLHSELNHGFTTEKTA